MKQKTWAANLTANFRLTQAKIKQEQRNIRNLKLKTEAKRRHQTKRKKNQQGEKRTKIHFRDKVHKFLLAPREESYTI